MRTCSGHTIPRRWLPFVGQKLGMVKSLFDMSVDPDDFDLHHVFPTATSLGRLLGRDSGFEARAGGVGIRLNDAIDRAMGELLERYASLAFDGGDRIVSSYAALRREGRRVVPFETVVPFSREQLAAPDFPYAEFTEDTPIGWIEGTNLIDGSPILVPGRLISFGYIPGHGEVSPCFYPTSSGCAAGTSLAGALLSGLLELIERDAIMIRWYARLAPPLLEIEPADLLGASVGLQTDGLEVRFHDLTMDGDVPVVGVTCVERTGRPCFFLLSAAAGLDVRTAARKALLEAGQGRPFIKMLANQGTAPGRGAVFNDFDNNLRFFAEPTNAKYAEWFFRNKTVSERRYSPMPDASDAAARLRALLQRCAAMSLTPIAFDMTTPEMEDHALSACRVFVPELVQLCIPSAPFLGHPRLSRFIAAAKREGLAESIPDWVPHPFP